MSDAASSLLHALRQPALYDHAVRYFRVLETHISWVLLTGDYAYKIKKPIDLGFLDFSTLEKRRRYCEEELRLNRRLAPRLYLDVIPITGTPEAPRLGGGGPAIEYAVKMAEFPQEAQLDRVLARGELRGEHIDALAATIAGFHERLPAAAPGTPHGEPENVWRPVEQNFTQIRAYLTDIGAIAQLKRLREWSEEEFARLRGVFAQRKQDGFIRECHGDMHLRNMALLDGEVVIFDCIEFSENLRWIDVMNEAAFLVMDLRDRGQSAHASRFLNGYLQITGDYEGIAVLRFYLVYRALVRAKVACIRLGQTGLSDAERETAQREARAYLALADSFIAPAPAPLMITHGLSGSGKTFITNSLLETTGAVRVRSDVERKRLFGLGAAARSGSALAGGIYTAGASERTYERLAQLARAIIGAGHPAIVDAAFLQRAQREHFQRLAAGLNAPFVIIDCVATENALRARVHERESAGADASEANLAVLEQQLRTQEPLAADEAPCILTVHAGAAEHDAVIH